MENITPKKDSKSFSKGDKISPLNNELEQSDSFETDSQFIAPKEGTFLDFQAKAFLIMKNDLMRNLALICKVKKPYIQRIDFSELYPNISRQFDVFTELINGGCIANQELLIENFNLGDLQIILMIIFRTIRNLDSPYLDLQ